MNYLKVGKLVLSAVTGYGAEKIIMNIVKATTPQTVSKLVKVTTVVSGSVIGMYVGDKMGTYAVETVDKTIVIVKEVVDKVKLRISEKSKV